MASILHSVGKETQLDAKFGGAQGAPKLPRDGGQVSMGRLEPITTGSTGSSPLPPRVPPPARASLCGSLRHLQLSRQLLVLKCCTRAVTQRLGLSGGHLAGLRPPWLHGPHL